MANSKKINISPGQGLLILIDHYKDLPEKVERLKKLYLIGALNPDDRAEIICLLKDKVLASFQVSISPDTINNDPTRRYFETHLSYESLREGLQKINKNDLDNHFQLLKNMLPPEKLSAVEHILQGKFNKNNDNLFKEYANYIRKIKSGRIFDQLSLDDRSKIELLAKCSFLGVMNAWYSKLPLNIYGKGIYLEKNKGKELVPGQNTTRTQNYGLMKSHMPIALNDIARSETEIPYLKPSDQAHFVDGAQWVKFNFEQLVHPFSNSISGTMLCQLRVHAELKNQGLSVFAGAADTLAQYSQLFISAMLFYSGGHTLNEFTAPFSLDAVKKEFRSIPGFNQINLESMYLSKNKEAFDSALNDTIEYNKSRLLKNKLNCCITEGIDVGAKKAAQMHLKINHEFISTSTIISAKQEHYSERIKNQWFSSYRSGAKKNILIQAGLIDVIKYIESGDIDKAKERITQLKNDLVSEFGKKNFWGQLSESYKLVKDVEKKLNASNTVVDEYKQQMKALSKETTPSVDSSIKVK